MIFKSYFALLTNLIIRFIIILCIKLIEIKSIELIKVNAIFNENKKLNAIVIAFFNSSIINLIDNLNEEANNLVNIDSYATKETILEITKERLL